MVHAKGLSDKTVESVLLNNDSEGDLDSGNINESSGSESQYEKSDSEVEDTPHC